MRGTFGTGAETSSSRFPPNAWWTRRVNPDIVAAIRDIYEVYDMAPDFIHSWEHKLGANAPDAGNSLVVVITAMWQEAMRHKHELQAREDDTTTLEADNPLLGLTSRRSETAEQEPQQGPSLSDAHASALPMMRTNAAYGSLHPNSASRATRNLSGAFDSTAREGGTVSAATADALNSLRQHLHDLPNAATEHEREIVTDSGTGITQDAHDTNTGSGAVSGLPENPFSQHRQWADRRAAEAPTASHTAGNTAVVHGEPPGPLASTTQQQTLQNTANTGPQSQAELNSAAKSLVHLKDWGSHEPPLRQLCRPWIFKE